VNVSVGQHERIQCEKVCCLQVMTVMLKVGASPHGEQRHQGGSQFNVDNLDEKKTK